MQVGYLIVAALLFVVGVLCFLGGPVLWFVGGFLIICGLILVYLSFRRSTATAVMAVPFPAYPDQWLHPNAPAMPPVAPLPVVVPVPAPPPAYQLPPNTAPPAQMALVWCSRCGRSQVAGTSTCYSCGQPL